MVCGNTSTYNRFIFLYILCAAPDDVPQEVVAVTVESRLIELSWSPPPTHTHNGEIVHYLIIYTEIQTGTNNTVVSFDIDVVLGNLHPFYDYLMTIAAYTIDFGPSSSPIIIQTLEDSEFQLYTVNSH